MPRGSAKRKPGTDPWPDATPLERKVRALIINTTALDLDELTPDSTLMADLGFDSLDVVELVMALEVGFGIVIEDDDGDRIGESTLGELFDYLNKRGAKA